MRIDEEDREQDSRTTISTLPGVVLTDPHREIDSSEVEPRVSLTRFLTKDAMIYGSVAKGYRGGGFNAASVPAAVFNVWRRHRLDVRAGRQGELG